MCAHRARKPSGEFYLMGISQSLECDNLASQVVSTKGGRDMSHPYQGREETKSSSAIHPAVSLVAPRRALSGHSH